MSGELAGVPSVGVMTTAFGPIQFKDFDGFKNQNPLAMVAQQVQGGAFVPVYPKAVIPKAIKFER